MSATRETKVALLGDASSYNRAFKSAEKSSDSFGKKVSGGTSKAVKGLGIIAGGVAIGGLALLSKGFMDGAHDLIAHEKLMAQTGAAIKSTGGGANVTAKHVDTLADRIEKMSGMDGDAIQSGENMLLTFTNIKNGVGDANKIFDKATSTLADMSQAMGADPQKQAVMLGKALNDPVKGIGALTKVGVTFTEGQKASIKAMEAHGNTAGAQKVILGELQKEFGGSAKAAGTTMAGQVNILKAHLSDLEQVIAAKVLPILNRMVAWAIEHWPEFQHYAEIAMAAIGTAWDTVLKPVIDAIISAVGSIVGVVQQHWDEISAIFTAAFTVIQGIVDLFIAVFKGDWGAAWDAIKQIVTGEFDLIKAELRLIVPILLGLLKTIGEKMLEGLKAGLEGLGEAALAGLKALPAAFIELHVLLFEAAKTLGGKVVGGIVDAVDGIAGKVVGFVDNIPGRLLELLKRAGDAGASVGGAIADGITGAFSGIGGAVEGLVKAALNKAIGLLNSGFNVVHDHWPDIPGAPGPPFGHNPIPALAKGGIVTRPTIALIGEAGPEAIIPLGRGGMGAGVHIANIDMRGTDGDPGAFDRRLSWSIRLAARGA